MLLLWVNVSRGPDGRGADHRYINDELECATALIDEEAHRRREDCAPPRAPLADRLAAALEALARHPAVVVLQE